MEEPIILSVPMGKYKGKFVFKIRNITTISANDFMDWIDTVYPGGLKERDEAYFSNLDTRISIFKNIITFWERWLTPGRDDSKCSVK